MTYSSCSGKCSYGGGSSGSSYSSTGSPAYSLLESSTGGKAGYSSLGGSGRLSGLSPRDSYLKSGSDSLGSGKPGSGNYSSGWNNVGAYEHTEVTFGTGKDPNKGKHGMVDLYPKI